jgi:hypothetical protein
VADSCGAANQPLFDHLVGRIHHLTRIHPDHRRHLLKSPPLRYFPVRVLPAREIKFKTTTTPGSRRTIGSADRSRRAVTVTGEGITVTAPLWWLVVSRLASSASTPVNRFSALSGGCRPINRISGQEMRSRWIIATVASRAACEKVLRTARGRIGS